MNKLKFMRCVNILAAGLLLLLASCGSSPHNLVPLPAVKPTSKTINTPLGPISVGTVKVLPTTYSKPSVSVIPFMGANSTDYPAKETAWPRSKFVIVAFEQPPSMQRPIIQKPILVVAGATNATQTRWYCAHYSPQDGKKFDGQRAFRPLQDSEKTIIVGSPVAPMDPFAFAFQVPENSTGGTLSLENVLYAIQW